MKSLSKFSSDHVGIVISCACLIHCLALPFVLLAMNITARESAVHTILFVGALLVAGHAVYHSYRKHCKHIVLFFACIGLLLIGADVMIELFATDSHAGHGHAGHVHGHDFRNGNTIESETHVETLTIIGSLFLMATHIMNLKFSRNTNCGECK